MTAEETGDAAEITVKEERPGVSHARLAKEEGHPDRLAIGALPVSLNRIVVALVTASWRLIPWFPAVPYLSNGVDERDAHRVTGGV
jgi:hypothetical protein